GAVAACPAVGAFFGFRSTATAASICAAPSVLPPAPIATAPRGPPPTSSGDRAAKPLLAAPSSPSGAFAKPGAGAKRSSCIEHLVYRMLVAPESGATVGGLYLREGSLAVTCVDG